MSEGEHDAFGYDYGQSFEAPDVTRDSRGSLPARASVLRFQCVSKDYASRAGSLFVALKEISFNVCDNELVSIIGPSGCGKSTLVRLAAGLLSPSSGSVEVLDAQPAVARARHEIAVVFQEPALLPWRSTLMNVALPGELAGLSKAEREARAQSLLQAVGLSGVEQFLPTQLSGGMRQRAAIARALMLNPRLVLMDEPFGALDHITRERLQSDFSEAWEVAGVTGLLVTHDIQEAVFMSDRIVVLTSRPGRIAGVIEVAEAHPRRDEFRTSPVFFDLCCISRDLLRDAFKHGESYC